MYLVSGVFITKVTMARLHLASPNHPHPRCKMFSKIFYNLKCTRYEKVRLLRIVLRLTRPHFLYLQDSNRKPYDTDEGSSYDSERKLLKTIVKKYFASITKKGRIRSSESIESCWKCQFYFVRERFLHIYIYASPFRRYFCFNSLVRASTGTVHSTGGCDLKWVNMSLLHLDSHCYFVHMLTDSVMYGSIPEASSFICDSHFGMSFSSFFCLFFNLTIGPTGDKV